MLSETSKKTLKRIFSWGQVLNLNPMYWDNSTGTVRFTRSKYRFALYCLVLSYLCAQAVYHFQLVVRGSSDPSVSFESYFKLIAHAGSRSVAIVFSFFYVFKGKEVAEYFNILFSVNTYIKGTFDERSMKKNPCRNGLWFLIGFMWLQPVTVAMTYVAEFRDAKYWQSIAIPAAIYPFTTTLWALDEYYVSVYCLNVLGITIAAMYTKVKLTNIWIAQLYKLEDVQVITQAYRVLQLFNQSFNATFHVIWSFGMFAGFFILVMTNVAAIHLVDKMPFPSNMMFPVACTSCFGAMFVVFFPAGAVLDSSRKFCRQFALSTDKRRRVIARSFRGLRIEMTAGFPLMKSTVLAYFSQIVDSTVSVLVITK